MMALSCGPASAKMGAAGLSGLAGKGVEVAEDEEVGVGQFAANVGEDGVVVGLVSRQPLIDQFQAG